MKKLTICFKIHQLLVLNQSILDAYYLLAVNVTEELRGELLDRIGLRENLSLELQSCLESATPKGIAGRPFLSCCRFLSGLAKLFSGKRIDLEKCQVLEYRNISSYYKILLSGKLPPELTPKLLQQKTRIEKKVLARNLFY